MHLKLRGWQVHAMLKSIEPMSDAPKSYMYIGKHMCASSLLLSEEIYQTCIQGFCAFPSWLLSCRIWSLFWCLLRVLCSLAFERVLTDSSYLVASGQDSVQLMTDLCWDSVVSCSLVSSPFPGAKTLHSGYPSPLFPFYRFWGSYLSPLGLPVYRALS